MGIERDTEDSKQNSLLVNYPGLVSRRDTVLESESLSIAYISYDADGVIYELFTSLLFVRRERYNALKSRVILR